MISRFPRGVKLLMLLKELVAEEGLEPPHADYDSMCFRGLSHIRQDANFNASQPCQLAYIDIEYFEFQECLVKNK